jgi:hypothetical protein
MLSDKSMEHICRLVDDSPIHRRRLGRSVNDSWARATECRSTVSRSRVGDLLRIHQHHRRFRGGCIPVRFDRDVSLVVEPG